MSDSHYCLFHGDAYKNCWCDHHRDGEHWPADLEKLKQLRKRVADLEARQGSQKQRMTTPTYLTRPTPDLDKDTLDWVRLYIEGQIEELDLGIQLSADHDDRASVATYAECQKAMRRLDRLLVKDSASHFKPATTRSDILQLIASIAWLAMDVAWLSQSRFAVVFAIPTVLCSGWAIWFEVKAPMRAVTAAMASWAVMNTLWMLHDLSVYQGLPGAYVAFVVAVICLVMAATLNGTLRASLARHFHRFRG